MITGSYVHRIMVKEIQCCWLWRWERGHGTRIGQGHGFSPRASKEFSPVNVLILARWDPCQISDLQNCKTTNLYCLSHQVWGNLSHTNNRKLIQPSSLFVYWGKRQWLSLLVFFLMRYRLPSCLSSTYKKLTTTVEDVPVFAARIKRRSVYTIFASIICLADTNAIWRPTQLNEK